MYRSVALELGGRRIRFRSQDAYYILKKQGFQVSHALLPIFFTRVCGSFSQESVVHTCSETTSRWLLHARVYLCTECSVLLNVNTLLDLSFVYFRFNIQYGG